MLYGPAVSVPITTIGTGLALSSGTLTNTLLTGLAGGQTVKGGTAASEALTLQSTDHATKGLIRLGAAGTVYYDEVNDRLGVGTSSPTNDFHVTSDGTAATRGVMISQHNSGIQAAVLAQKKSYGTKASPTVVASGSYGAANFISHYDGTAYRNTAFWGTRVIAAPVDNTTVGTSLWFGAYDAGSSDPYGTRQMLELYHDGTAKIGVFGIATPVARQTGGENVTNSVTNDGSTAGTIPDITDGTTYASDYVNLRRALYQIARMLKQDHDALRAYGWLT